MCNFMAATVVEHIKKKNSLYNVKSTHIARPLKTRNDISIIKDVKKSKIKGWGREVVFSKPFTRLEVLINNK